MSYIYLLTNDNNDNKVYELTTKNTQKSDAVFKLKIDNPDEYIDEISLHLKNNFVNYELIGNEYFEGNYVDMSNIIFDIVLMRFFKYFSNDITLYVCVKLAEILDQRKEFVRKETINMYKKRYRNNYLLCYIYIALFYIKYKLVDLYYSIYCLIDYYFIYYSSK